MFSRFWPTVTLKFAAETMADRVVTARARVAIKCIFMDKTDSQVITLTEKRAVERQ